jgi:hypothetical protein
MKIWKEFQCPDCNHWLTSFDLAEIHFTGNCPACHNPFNIDAKESLTKAKAATIFAAALTALFVCIDGALLHWIGITDQEFNTWLPSVRLLLILVVVLAGVSLIVFIRTLIINLLLNITARRLLIKSRK